MPYKDTKQQKLYLRQWYIDVVKQRRDEWFSDKVCVDCGSTTNLEMDHVDPKKKVSHRIWSWSNDRRVEELNKCVARCKECHRKKTNIQISKPNNHGTRGFYMLHKCRCEKCKKAASDYRNEQRYRTGKRKNRQDV